MKNLTIKSQSSIGYHMGVFGVVLVLLWIGIYKFTPTEADIIKPLVENHPLMGWLYNILSVQAVSNLIGAAEIVVAVGLIIGLKKPLIGYWSGVAAAAIFVVTLSFLFTTPNVWKVTDGVLVTNFFLVKDILFLGVAAAVIERNKALLGKDEASAVESDAVAV